MKYNRYPKRDAIKNYFPLPNEIFVWVSPAERSLSMHICSTVRTEKLIGVIRVSEQSVTH